VFANPLLDMLLAILQHCDLVSYSLASNELFFACPTSSPDARSARTLHCGGITCELAFPEKAFIAAKLRA